MSDAAILGWGMMIGSWITSLWIMRKDHEPTRSRADLMLEAMASKVDRALLFAPDCTVRVDQQMEVRGKRFLVTVAPSPMGGEDSPKGETK